jgi:hypothetical protein
MRCKIVLGGVASCREVPDAIGWSNSWRGGYGSIVVECRRSMSDFYRDRKKNVRSRTVWSDSLGDFVQPVHPATKTAPPRKGFSTVEEEVPRMGDRRYFLCPWGVISEDAVIKHFPDHGLLWLRGRSVHLVHPAPKRANVSHATEVVLLKFALIHMRDNLLAAGLTVDLRELTKHPIVADRSGMLDGFVKCSTQPSALSTQRERFGYLEPEDPEPDEASA